MEWCRFAGASDELALVIAGVHGDEAMGVAVARRLVARLSAGEVPRYTTVLVPVLFPDTFAAGLRDGAIAPSNRNFPPPGHNVGELAQDALGRPILPENLWLMRQMSVLQPARMASIHATRRPEAAGVFSDPHPDNPARTAQASALALSLAEHLAAWPHLVAGNGSPASPNSTWSGRVDGGVSLGAWAPVPIPGDRPDILLLTIELPGLEAPRSDEDPRSADVNAMVDALLYGFLETTQR